MWSKNWHFFPLLTLVSSFVESGEVFRGVVWFGRFLSEKSAKQKFGVHWTSCDAPAALRRGLQGREGSGEGRGKGGSREGDVGVERVQGGGSQGREVQRLTAQICKKAQVFKGLHDLGSPVWRKHRVGKKRFHFPFREVEKKTPRLKERPVCYGKVWKKKKSSLGWKNAKGGKKKLRLENKRSG